MITGLGEEARAAGQLAAQIAAQQITPYVEAWGAPGVAGPPSSVADPFAAAGLLDDDLSDDVGVEVAVALGRAGLAVAVRILGLDPARGATDLRLAAALAGSGDTLITTGLEYAREREVFGRPLAKMPVQRNLFATAAARVDAALALTRRAAAVGDPLDRAAAVPVAADAAWLAAETALQVHGGYGYTDDFPVSRMWREVVTVRAALPRSAYDRAVADAIDSAR